MLEPPLPIWLSTIRSESSEMDESTSIWLQFPFGFGVMKREKYWRFFVKLREITLGESSRSEINSFRDEPYLFPMEFSNGGGDAMEWVLLKEMREW